MVVLSYPAAIRARIPSSTAMSSAQDVIILFVDPLGIFWLERGCLNVQASQRSWNQKPIPLPDASTNISGMKRVEEGDDGRGAKGDLGDMDGVVDDEYAGEGSGRDGVGGVAHAGLRQCLNKYTCAAVRFSLGVSSACWMRPLTRCSASMSPGECAACIKEET